MEPSLEVGVSELHLAAARLQDAGQRLQDRLSNVDLQVRETLGSGWRGDAASAFGSAWEQWHGGAGQVIHAIEVMAELLTVAGKEYAKTDQHGAQAIGSQMHGGGGAGGLGGGAGSIPAAAGSIPASAGSIPPAGGGPSGVGELLSQVGSLAEQMLTSVPPLGQLVEPLVQAGQVAAELAEQLTAEEPDLRDDDADRMQSEDEARSDGMPTSDDQPTDQEK